MKKPKKKRQVDRTQSDSRYASDNELREIEKQVDNEEEHYFDLIDKEVKPTDTDLTIFNPESDLEEAIEEINKLNFDHEK